MTTVHLPLIETATNIVFTVVEVDANDIEECAIPGHVFKGPLGPSWVSSGTKYDPDTNTYVAEPVPPVSVTMDDIVVERQRRLSLGFDYDFQDGRGVHHIGTTDEDMIGWDEVTKFSQAAINIGAPNTLMNILTDTGSVQITALEWQAILMRATAVRQPIWMSSFALMAMQTIPTDYKDNKYWSGS